MTTRPKREYTRSEIEQQIDLLRNGYGDYVGKIECADMLEQLLASQIAAQNSYVHQCDIHSDYQPACPDCMKGIPEKILAAQKREGDPRQAPAEVMMHWKPMLEWALGTIAELGDGEISGEDSILYAQAKMLCLAGAPSPDQDREVSP